MSKNRICFKCLECGFVDWLWSCRELMNWYCIEHGEAGATTAYCRRCDEETAHEIGMKLRPELSLRCPKVSQTYFDEYKGGR